MPNSPSLLPHTPLLSETPDPERARGLLSRLRERQPQAFARMERNPAALQAALAVFSHSHFLSEALLQRPEWLEALCLSGDLHRSFSGEEFVARLEAALGPGVPPPAALALYRRRELLRILLRDVRGLAHLSETTEELSHLAGAVLEVTYGRIRGALAARHGEPEGGMSILSVGKLGGLELNYSSDIDLFFVYERNGETAGPDSISNKEFFRKAATQLTDLLSHYTPEGIIYRVDLRLRPDGKHGEVVLSLDGAREYYRTRGRDWELQMLIKARVAAGEPRAGRELLEFAEPLIYSTTLDFTAVEAVSETRLRIHEQLAARKAAAGEVDVKLRHGGIRDIEFLVQCLQRLHGGREPWVRHGGTMLALGRLRDKDLLSPSEYARLASAYQFLRHLEHRLQYADDRQTHSLPHEPAELALLARRMPAAEVGTETSAARLLHQLHLHLEEVQEIYERVIHAQQPVYLASAPAPEPPSNLVRFLDQKAPGLAATLGARPLVRGEVPFEHFLEKLFDAPVWLRALDQDRALAERVLVLFETSPFLTERLIRTPDLLAELEALDEPLPPPPGGAEAGELRRYYARGMFRIQAASICLRVPVFTSLGRTSALSEAILKAAYAIASPGETAMMVIALGRLGMREFDLGSDADLVFVIPDGELGAIEKWTRAAERMIEIVSAYTGDGMMFSIDTRLRPNGGAGALVQTESAVLEYFEKQAEAWEGMAYMKSHAVAGDLERATEFLNRLQQIDWRRYGQSGRSRGDLRQMRLRLQREQGSGNPLKAGYGGYYDIDFALLYLRLRSAGFFFKQLNTPARIDVIEKMGHLDRADAEFLRHAATFYRAVDHGLRLIFGHAEGKLPRSPLHLEMLTDICGRWTGEEPGSPPLPETLAHIEAQTREFFDRLFAG